MKIFIAGCGRSGTRLMLNLMKCFSDLYCHPVEADVAKFDELVECPAKHLVVKRTFQCHQKLPNLPDSIELIYCVRHPFDVLTSSMPSELFFHITPKRWLAEYQSLKELRTRQPDRSIFFSKYEELIRQPNVIQAKVAGVFGLVPIRRFNEDPENPIREISLRKWERNLAFRLYLGRLDPTFIDRIRAISAWSLATTCQICPTVIDPNFGISRVHLIEDHEANRRMGCAKRNPSRRHRQ